MAKCLYVWSREKMSGTTKDKLFNICKRIEPDNIHPPDPKIELFERYSSLSLGNSTIFVKSTIWLLERFNELTFFRYSMPARTATTATALKTNKAP